MFYNCSDEIREAGRWNINHPGRDYYTDKGQITHYVGELGEFNYNDREFDFDKEGYLRYIGEETDGREIKIPDGIKNCYGMFAWNETLEYPPVIPDSVENCFWMFSRYLSL